MKTFLRCLLIGFVIGAILSSCATSRQPGGDAVTSEPTGYPSVDSLGYASLDVLTVQPHRSKLAEVLGRPAPPVQVYARPAGSAAPLIGRTGKRSTTTVYQGPVHQTSTGKKGQTLGAGATNVERAKAPVGTGWGDVTNQPRAANAAAVHGDDNWLEQKAPPAKPKPTAWQLLRPWVLGIGGIVATGLVAYNWATVAGFFGLLFSVFKRKKSTDPPS